MTKILLVTSSPRGAAASFSTKVALALIERLKAGEQNTIVAVRDLTREPLPHIDEAFVTGLATPPEQWTQTQREAMTRSDALVAELQAADVVVIASAMINFGVASPLKAWLDHVIRSGVTFRYTPEGKVEGLLHGKRVYLVVARGGIYAEGPMSAMDFQEPYLRGALEFIGITDVEMIRIEGIAFGPDAAAKAMTAALDHIGSSAIRLAA
jgi:FMN-dependent NADH-azoreductase